MKATSFLLTYIRRLGDRSPRTITFADYLKGTEEIRTRIESVRSGGEKKTDLPAIIPAGIFRNGYQMEHLRRMTGFASFDIDNVKNPDAAKKYLSEIPWVYYAALSASGKGVWGLLKFSSSSEYVFHYSALLNEFKARGVEIDPTGANVNRLRFYSFDPDAYLNENSEVYKKKEIGVFRTSDGKSVDWRVGYEYRFTQQELTMKYRFDRTYFCEDLFEQAGWTVQRPNYKGQMAILRPGSDKSQSGNILKNQAWIFTSSTNFIQNSLNSPFDCFVFLFHDGDAKKALRQIRLEGMV